MNGVTVEAQMMIRKPVEEVFLAFIDPNITTKFWYTKSTGPLKKGKTVTWEWEMYKAKAEVHTINIIPNKLIATRWGNPSTLVDYEFRDLSPQNTYVTIKNYGFTETGEELLKTLMNNTGGFTTVLDGLKAYLEHGIQLNLVADKFPHYLQD